MRSYPGVARKWDGKTVIYYEKLEMEIYGQIELFVRGRRASAPRTVLLSGAELPECAVKGQQRSGRTTRWSIALLEGTKTNPQRLGRRADRGPRCRV